MDEPKIPSGFDWVTARANCSLAGIFARLKAELAVDVEKKNAIDGDNYMARYVLSPSNGSISVTLAEGNLPIDSVVFEVTRMAIEVKDANGKTVITATPTLSDDGVCRLKIGDVECELWQLRKRALEKLFFRD